LAGVADVVRLGNPFLTPQVIFYYRFAAESSTFYRNLAFLLLNRKENVRL